MTVTFNSTFSQRLLNIFFLSVFLQTPDFVSSAQDYHWQWRSFLTSGFTALYFLIYAIHYFFSKLQITGLASTILYFGYTLIMALIFFLFTGRCIIFFSWMFSLTITLTGIVGIRLFIARILKGKALPGPSAFTEHVNTQTCKKYLNYMPPIKFCLSIDPQTDLPIFIVDWNFFDM